VGDLADDREGSAEQLVGVLDGAAQHEPADVAGGHDLAVDLEQVDDARLEARVGAQQLLVAGRLVAEAEVLPHADVLGLQRPTRTSSMKLCALRRRTPRRRDDDELLDAELARQLGPCARAWSAGAARRPGDDGRGVRLEGDDGVGAADDLAVAEVDAVEGADGDPARRGSHLGSGSPSSAEPYDGLQQAVLAGLGDGHRAVGVGQQDVLAPSASPAIACPWPARHAASASTSTRGRKASACSSGSDALRDRRPRRRTARCACAAAPRSSRRPARR
jgi:hypothetical protein